jgi:predicted nucleic acid-binding protein
MALHAALRTLVDAGEAILLGPIRQEILSGIKDERQFDLLRDALRGFPDEPIRFADYESAAQMFNLCRANGIQGSNTDFLICAVSVRLSAPIYSLDKDFELYHSILPIRLYQP